MLPRKKLQPLKNCLFSNHFQLCDFHWTFSNFSSVPAHYEILAHSARDEKVPESDQSFEAEEIDAIVPKKYNSKAYFVCHCFRGLLCASFFFFFDFRDSHKCKDRSQTPRQVSSRRRQGTCRKVQLSTPSMPFAAISPSILGEPFFFLFLHYLAINYF